jgi:hypothetical protein
MHSHPWYYEMQLGDKGIVGTLHLDEGVTIAGHSTLLRVSTRDRVTTLRKPGPGVGEALATYFVGNAGLFATVKRITVGDRRAGGYELDGNGWRGSWLLDAEDGERVVSFAAQGDPATRYCIAPVPGRSVPLVIVALAAYIMMDREAHGWAVATRLERRRRVRRESD